MSVCTTEHRAFPHRYNEKRSCQLIATKKFVKKYRVKKNTENQTTYSSKKIMKFKKNNKDKFTTTTTLVRLEQ